MRTYALAGEEEETSVKQPNTEESIEHTDDQQNTGNHKVSGERDAGGADRFGGTRSGAENVEHVPVPPKDGSTKPDVTGEGGAKLDGSAPPKQPGELRETHPERDENGRL